MLGTGPLVRVASFQGRWFQTCCEIPQDAETKVFSACSTADNSGLSEIPSLMRGAGQDRLSLLSHCGLILAKRAELVRVELISADIGQSYLTHSFILRKEEVPVCVACDAVITAKHILIECTNLMEIRKKYFEERP